MSASHGRMTPDDPAYAGQREYTARLLRIYDPLVLGLYCRLVWRCPAARLERHYTEHLRRRHLDVGPGTGRFLARTQLPPKAQLTLLDPNPDVLTYAARRLRGLDVTLVEADVCKPLPLGAFATVERTYDNDGEPDGERRVDSSDPHGDPLIVLLATRNQAVDDATDLALPVAGNGPRPGRVL